MVRSLGVPGTFGVLMGIRKWMNFRDLPAFLNRSALLCPVFIAFCTKAAYRSPYCACKGHRESWPDAVDLTDPLIVPLYQRLQLSLGPDFRWLRFFQSMFQEFVNV